MNNTFAFLFQKITTSTPHTTLHIISFHFPVLFISKTQLFHHLISIPSSCVLLSLFPSTDAHHPSGCGVLTHPPLTCVVSTPPPLPDRVGCSLTGVCSHTRGEGRDTLHAAGTVQDAQRRAGEPAALQQDRMEGEEHRNIYFMNRCLFAHSALAPHHRIHTLPHAVCAQRAHVSAWGVHTRCAVLSIGDGEESCPSVLQPPKGVSGALGRTLPMLRRTHGRWDTPLRDTLSTHTPWAHGKALLTRTAAKPSFLSFGEQNEERSL